MNPADTVHQWPIERLIPYARNSRTHSDAQVAQIAASIKEWGWTTPVLVDEGGQIIAGHGRIMAARKLGMAEVPVVIAKGWSDAQKRAYVIADNKLALNAGWDNDLLALEFGELEGLGFDLELTGFSLDEIDALKPVEVAAGLTDEDAVPEVQDNPVTVEGDVWIMGKHRLMCGDSTSIDAVEKLMAGKKADMVFTDPPYGMNLDTDYSKLPSTKKEGNKKYSLIIGDDKQFNHADFHWIDCKEQIWFGANYYAKSLPDGGSWLVWDKRVEEKFDKMFGSCFELAWSKTPHKQKIYRHNNTLFSGNAEAKNKVHPTQKPTQLCIDIIIELCNQDDLVLDLFGGSGSTLIACEKTARDCRLMELDPKYCDVIVKRWQDFTGKQATLEATGQTFAEVSNGKASQTEAA